MHDVPLWILGECMSCTYLMKLDHLCIIIRLFYPAEISIKTQQHGQIQEPEQPLHISINIFICNEAPGRIITVSAHSWVRCYLKDPIGQFLTAYFRFRSTFVNLRGAVIHFPPPEWVFYTLRVSPLHAGTGRIKNYLRPMGRFSVGHSVHTLATADHISYVSYLNILKMNATNMQT